MRLWFVVLGIAGIFLGYALSSALIDLIGIILLVYGIAKKEKGGSKKDGH